MFASPVRLQMLFLKGNVCKTIVTNIICKHNSEWIQKRAIFNLHLLSMFSQGHVISQYLGPIFFAFKIVIFIFLFKVKNIKLKLDLAKFLSENLQSLLKKISWNTVCIIQCIHNVHVHAEALRGVYV